MPDSKEGQFNSSFRVGRHLVGSGNPTFIVAEISANHHQDFGRAVQIIEEAKRAGADAIKLQTYTADTMTLNCNRDPFIVRGGTLWDGKTLYELYQQAYTPWEWQPKLKEIAESLGMECFSTPFDSTSVDFLEDMDVPAHKIASFELTDIPLVEYVASKGRPIIMSTGMASESEIEEAIAAVVKCGCRDLVLLKCTSAYPAPPSSMNLGVLPFFARRFSVPVGLSDHTLDITVPIAATALGGCLIEKHFTLSRSDPGPDSAFSLEPKEFKAMVDAVRTTEASLGVLLGSEPKEEAMRAFRRSLFAAKDIERGELFTSENVRSVRPSKGLAPKYYKQVIGKRATQRIAFGTPLSEELVEGLKS